MGMYRDAERAEGAGQGESFHVREARKNKIIMLRGQLF